ncbi:MAG TPA: NAD-dependent epimerase/dehydratase family protein [Cyclobacteriaceae bacterium]|nr:NAD-dependent epimerase/dehydratase family protein [Cyclobacteriaceae bacterium]
MITIVGGSGFIGSRLSRRLKEKNTAFQIIDKRVGSTFPDETIVADVRDLESLIPAIKGEVIINLAAEHRDDVTPKSLYDEVNVVGAKHVCDVAEAHKINKIIFTSSVAVYGFAPVGTDETGTINYFNDYGRTKYEAEQVYRNWQKKDPEKRTLVIIRPTVVFGEQNRGNVYNLLKLIASGKFAMVGNGKNVKSMAYVENIAAFLEYSINFGPGVHLYNYVDKPDFNMNQLVKRVNKALGKKESIGIRIPYPIGYTLGKILDVAAALSGIKFPISSIRIKKFCSDTSFDSSAPQSGFKAPVHLETGLSNTIKHEFLQKNEGELFYSE